MSQPDWTGFAEGKMASPAGPKRPRNTRGPLCAALIAIACLYGMCRIPNWDGADPRGLTAQERADALRSPLPSDEKRRAAVVELKRAAMESVRLLCEIAEEGSPASEDARNALAHLRAELDR